MSNSREQQEFFMRYALSVGEKGRLMAPPNPWVGCVIVKDGEIVGEGYHKGPGTSHAENVALSQAGVYAKGGTAYITLEPCSHFGRTPPCVKVLLESGINCVVIPFADPDAKVSGNGIRALKAGGIEVVLGVAKAQAEKSLAPYLYHRKTALPYIVLKMALSLDGKVAAADASSKWITGEEARRDVHLQRAESQAILVGAKTALLDLPNLTVRDIETSFKAPLRVVVDAKGIVSPNGPLFDASLGKTVIFTTQNCLEKTLTLWEKKGVETVTVASSPAGVDLRAMCHQLAKRDVVQLLVEGGPTLMKSFIDQKFFQRLSLYYGGCFLGSKGHTTYLNDQIISMQDALYFQLDAVSRFGNDIRVDYIPKI